MSKRLKREIKETNFDKLKAYSMCRRNDTKKMKDCVGEQFKIDGHVFYDSIISNDETGEIETKECLVLSTDIGTIGTASKSAIPAYKEIIELFADIAKEENMDFNELLKSKEFKITKGQTANGTFNTIELC